MYRSHLDKVRSDIFALTRLIEPQTLPSPTQSSDRAGDATGS